MIQAATDAGVFHLSAERRVELEGRDVRALVRGDEGWWAIVDGHEVWHRTVGDGWSRVADIPERRLNCLLPSDDGLFVGTSEAHLLRLSDGRAAPVDAFENTAGRDDWFTPWGGPPDVRSLARAPSGRLYANVHVGGILRSDDAGGTWTQTIDIRSDVHEVVAPTGDLVLAATAAGLATSSDAGDTWTFDDEELHGSYARAVAWSDGIVFVSASLGPRGGRAALYRHRLDGEAFVKCGSGLPEWFEDNIDTGCVAASGERVAFGTGDGRVFASDDAGETWNEIASGLPSITRLVFSD